MNKRQLEELVNSLAWNDGYGCYTRAGFEKLIWPTIAETARWIIFFDIGNMHDLNEIHGHSGDEFIICVTDDPAREPSNPLQLCERLQVIFSENGVPATFAIVPVHSKSLIENVDPAVRLVEEAKAQNRRGRIYFETK